MTESTARTAQANQAIADLWSMVAKLESGLATSSDAEFRAEWNRLLGVVRDASQPMDLPPGGLPHALDGYVASLRRVEVDYRQVADYLENGRVKEISPRLKLLRRHLDLLREGLDEGVRQLRREARRQR